MKKIYLKRVFHRGNWRYAIVFPYDAGLVNIAKTLTGMQYSTSNNFFYVDCTEDALREILRSFKGRAEIDISAISYRSDFSGKDHLPEIKQDEQEMPHVISITSDDLDQEEEDFFPPGDIPQKASGHSKYSPVEFRIDERDGRLSIKFTGYYDKQWIAEMKTYGKFYYDKVHREFLLRWSKITVDSLSDYFASRGVIVRVIRRQPGPGILDARKSSGDEVRSRKLKQESYEGLELLRRHLEENRYSSRTVDTYLSQLELFFKYFNEKCPGEITHDEVTEFIGDFIIKNGFSASFQNQTISAIKLFYEISGRGKVIPQILERPRRSRSLPKVFSKEEIVNILNATRNNKHKLLLWLIYSCGLRRSEVTNIKLTDIDRNRNILHIREGKGGVDRIVPVSEKVWTRLDEYIDGYRPRNYLFEGQKGERYSVESVYNVFKKALKNAGINKEVGVHSLRHSYATHLHESGLDIRYIQELLGHKSTRTTEIYTHVSRRNLVSVRSPIDDLDVNEQVVEYLKMKKIHVAGEGKN